MFGVLNTGQPCTIEFVTLDRKRNKGGELRTLVDAVKKGANEVKLPSVSAMQSGKADASRNPNHTAHGTINVVCADGSMHKVHTRLITKFNNEEVVL